MFKTIQAHEKNMFSIQKATTNENPDLISFFVLEEIIKYIKF